jgi:hypothetical protein
MPEALLWLLADVMEPPPEVTAQVTAVFATGLPYASETFAV